MLGIKLDGLCVRELHRFGDGNLKATLFYFVQDGVLILFESAGPYQGQSAIAGLDFFLARFGKKES